MSDHVDGDAPALARDAAGVRLTDAQAVALARYVALGWFKGESPPSFASDTDSDKDAEMLARYVLAVAPVVAAAREWAAWMGDSDGRWGNGAELLDALEAAVRALDGDA